jgi:hypothetical protein
MKRDLDRLRTFFVLVVCCGLSACAIVYLVNIDL